MERRWKMTNTINWRRALLAIYLIASIATLLYTIGAPATEGH
jgi:hypothetical protein